jgi:hypothetical protein
MKQNVATTWQIGQATVTRIEELLGPAFRPEGLLATWDPAVLEEHGHWMAPDFYVPSSDQFIMSVHSWLIRTPHHNILVDTCCGNAKNRPGSPHFHQLDTPYLDRLQATGVAPEDIDYVLCASPRRSRRLEYPIARRPLGADLSERQVRLFQRGVELLGPLKKSASATGAARRLCRLRVPVIAAKQDHVVRMTDQLGDSLLIEPAPGHSPGQIMLRLLGDQDEGLFIGDVMHNPIQVYQPTWNSRVCMDPEQAVQSRLRVLGHCAEHNSLMFPAHFGAPHAGRIRSRANSFSFAPEEAR